MTGLYDDMTPARRVRTRVPLEGCWLSVRLSSTVKCICKARLKLEGQLRSLTLSECGHDVEL